METKATLIEKKQTSFDKLKIVKLYLYYKLMDMSILDKFSSRDINILSNLYIYGGTTKETFGSFIDLCYSLNLCKEGSENSIRNCLTLARENGIVKRRRSKEWKIDKDILPQEPSDLLYLKLFLTNYDL